MEDHTTNLKTRQEVDRMHVRAHLAMADSHGAKEYERYLTEVGLELPNEAPASFFDHYRQASVTAAVFLVAIFLHAWGVI